MRYIYLQIYNNYLISVLQTLIFLSNILMGRYKSYFGFFKV
ncbi:MAG: hypothetical protein TRG1_62 [Flavobacteriaceae bacterium FS1-H7996/R]|nr:MAG: hypothetical protein TRG1_62 [Flavobacteriaceae bacterium FS1-H7996/R]